MGISGIRPMANDQSYLPNVHDARFQTKPSLTTVEPHTAFVNSVGGHYKRPRFSAKNCSRANQASVAEK